VVAVPRVELSIAAATFGADDSVHDSPAEVATDGSIIVAPTSGTDGVVINPVVDCNIAAATFGLAADTPNPKVAASAAAATFGIAEGVIVLVSASVGASIAAATSGTDDSAHDAPADVEIDGTNASAATFCIEGVSAEPIVRGKVVTAALPLTVDSANPTAAASVDVATSGTDGVTLLVLANVGDNVVTATFWVVLNTISLDADIVGIIVVIPTFCGVACVNADASVGASAATATFGCVGCVKPSPIGGDTMATPTLGTVTSAILSVSLIVGARVVAATFDGVPKVIVSAVAIVGVIVTAATFGTGEVIPNALVIATTAAATFGGVTAVIAEAKVRVVIAAATFCGVGSRILSASPIVGASVETATF